MNEKKILILTHEDGRFATKFVGTMEKHEGTNMDTYEMKILFEDNGFSCSMLKFSELDMRDNYKGYFVVYASSEDYGKFYKNYIEDIILRLQLDGAILLPNYIFLRAHANKSFQELLRASFDKNELREPYSISVGSYGELKGVASRISYPCVVKTSSGSGSSGVILVHNEEELYKHTKKLMTIHYVDYSRDLIQRIKLYIWRMIKILTKHKHSQPISEKMQTNKVVIQGFIPGLEGDYKVLYFYERYYILHRNNRKNDFRASGSGDFLFPELSEEVIKVLDYAKMVSAEIDQPMISMDIVSSGTDKCYLIEFQCVYFGPLTMQYSPFYYENKDGIWTKENNKHSLEEEYCRSIVEYIGNHYS